MTGSHLVDVQRAVALMDRAAMRGASNFGNRCDDTGVVARRPAAGTRRASGLRGLNAERKLTMAIPFSGRPTRSCSRRHVTGSSLLDAGTPVFDYLTFLRLPHIHAQRGPICGRPERIDATCVLIAS